MRRPRLPEWLCRALLARLKARTVAIREPDFVIGGRDHPYLRRWYVIPRNRWMNIYFHEFLRSDEDRALHDHPWASMSVILAGGYNEVMPAPGNPNDLIYVMRFTGAVSIRGPRAAHRVELLGHAYGNPYPAWTLFVTGPRVRDWGFLCARGWVPWQKFSDPNDRGAVGPGCDADYPSGKKQP